MEERPGKEQASNPVADRLDKVIRLLSLLVITGKGQKEQILVLAKAGFPNKDIADLVGITPNAVKVSLYQTRKKATPGRESIETADE